MDRGQFRDGDLRVAEAERVAADGSEHGHRVAEGREVLGGAGDDEGPGALAEEVRLVGEAKLEAARRRRR